MFKLSKGAASANVRLIRTAKQAKRLLKRAFGQGFIPVATVGNLFEKPGALFTHVRANDFRIETLDFSWVTGDGGWVNIVQLTTVWKASEGVFVTLGYKRDEETL